MAIKKGKIRTLDDIQRDRSNAEREEVKDRIVGDINDVITKITFRPKRVKPITIILLGILILFLLLIFANFVLLNIWAFKFFIKSLFFGG